MSRSRSWLRPAVVAVSLLVSLCAGTLAPPHAEGTGDFGCSPIFIGHDERAHYIGAAPSSRHDEAQHCFLCHSLRSFHRVFDKYEQRDGTLRAEPIHAALLVFAGRLEWALAPGRAPPAFIWRVGDR